MALNWQNNNFTRAPRFFVHFFAVAALLRRETSYFHVFWRTGIQDNDFPIFVNVDTVYQNSSHENIRQIEKS